MISLRKKQIMKRLIGTAVLLSVLVPFLYVPSVSALDKNTGGTNTPEFNFDELDNGIYWYGMDNTAVKFVEGEVNPNFDPDKPTVIYAHGWQNGSSKNQFRETFNPHLNDAACELDEYTANYWIAKGWNIGIFYWSQLADEEEVKDAEAKIWTATDYTYVNDSDITGMRWKNSKGEYCTQNAPTVSVAEIFCDEYCKAMKEYSGKEVRMVGHSLGNQVATRTSALINEKIAAGEASENIMPDRLTLHDPFFSNGTKNYLGGKKIAEKCNEYIVQLKANGMAVERYDSGLLNSDAANAIGDGNAAGRKLVAFFDYYPDYYSQTQVGEKHGASRNWWFTFMRSETDIPVYSRRFSFGYKYDLTGDSFGSSITPTAKLARLMNEKTWWYQHEGKSTFGIEDDTWVGLPNGDGNKDHANKNIVVAQDTLQSLQMSYIDDTVVEITCTASENTNDISRFVAYVNGQRFIGGRKGTEDFYKIRITGLSPKNLYTAKVGTISEQGWESQESSWKSISFTTDCEMKLSQATVSGTNKVNDTITLIMEGKCDHQLKYGVWIYEKETGKIVMKQEFGSEKVATFVPKQEGDYQIVMKAIDTQSQWNRLRVKEETIHVSKKEGQGKVLIEDWSYGTNCQQPVVESETNGTSEVSYYYKKIGEEMYRELDIKNDNYPQEAGAYELKVVIASTDEFNEVVCYDGFNITKNRTNVIRNHSVEDWYYGGEPQYSKAKANFGQVEFFYYLDEACTKGESTEIPTKVGTYWVKAKVNETNNYNGAESVTSFSIKYLATPEVARIQNMTSSEWVQKAVIQAPKGFQISDTLDGSYSEVICVETETGNKGSDVDYYLKDAMGNKTDKKSIKVKIDCSAPVFLEKNGITIVHSNNWWTELLQQISFGIYEKEQTVELKATDYLSGVKGYYYYIQKNETGKVSLLTAEQLQQLDTELWNYSENGSFDLKENGNYIIYAYAIDEAGNQSDYISSEGISISIPKVENHNYEILDGKNKEIILFEDVEEEVNSNKKQETLVIRGAGDVEKFVKVMVDEKEVDNQYYRVTSGSTIITFQKAFLKMLSNGTHEIELIWTDGNAKTSFVISRKEAEVEKTEEKEENSSTIQNNSDESNTNVKSNTSNELNTNIKSNNNNESNTSVKSNNSDELNSRVGLNNSIELDSGIKINNNSGFNSNVAHIGTARLNAGDNYDHDLQEEVGGKQKENNPTTLKVNYNDSFIDTKQENNEVPVWTFGIVIVGGIIVAILLAFARGKKYCRKK